MSSTVLYMSMSLDGFIAGPNESPDNGLGDGGHRLHEWCFPGAVAVRDAKHAAAEKNVLVHGAGIAPRALAAGLLDEIEITLVPVLFGDGRRLFEHLDVGPLELERVRVFEGEGGVTHLRYRVRR